MDIHVLTVCIVGSDTDPPGAGAAAEPPPPLTFGCVSPKVAAIAIVTRDNVVLDNLVAALGR